MYKKIGVAKFRSQLKASLEQAIDHKGMVYEIAAKEPVLVLSEHTLSLLQKRYANNHRIASHYEALCVEKYGVLAAGTHTKALPMGDLLGLHALFRLVSSLVHVLQQTGAKQNASKWDVTAFVEAGLHKTSPIDGAFSDVAELVGRFLSKEQLEVPDLVSPAIPQTFTLGQFFALLERHATGMLFATDTIHRLSVETQDAAQRDMLLQGMVALCSFAQSLIDMQGLEDRPPCAYFTRGAYKAWNVLLDWFQTHVNDAVGSPLKEVGL